MCAIPYASGRKSLTLTGHLQAGTWWETGNWYDAPRFTFCVGRRSTVTGLDVQGKVDKSSWAERLVVLRLSYGHQGLAGGCI